MPYAIATACPICFRAECKHQGVARTRPRNWKAIASRVIAAHPWCSECGERGRLIVDHIVPLSAGGSEARENLRVLCVACHGERLEGFGGRARG